MRQQDDTRATAERWFREVWTERRREAIREMWKPGATCSVEGASPVTMEYYLAYHEQMLGAFSDFRVDVLGIVTDGNQAAVEWRITGTHDGPLMGIPPSGHVIEEYGITIMIIEDGKLAGGRDSWNFGALLDRLSRPPLDAIVSRHGLTRRQSEVALLLADRLSTKAIAKELGIAYITARRHCQAVLRRLGVSDRRSVSDVLSGSTQLSVGD